MDSTASTSTVDLKAHKLETVYFGGGTPSLMSSCDIGRILEKINTHFDVSIEGGGALDSDRDRDSKGKGFGTEVTMEMDPGTFDLQQIQELKSMGVNRVSLGVQSFDDSLLERSGRAHRVIGKSIFYFTLHILQSIILYLYMKICISNHPTAITIMPTLTIQLPYIIPLVTLT